MTFQILKDRVVWKEIADILVQIRDGEGAKYDDLKDGTIEKAYFEQETDKILTIIALKVFPKYLQNI